MSAATLAAIGLGDGPDSSSVRVRVSDGEATTTSNATTLTITNAAPSASLSNSGDVVEGESASVSFSELTDPSAADATAGLRYAYDFDGQYAVGDASYAGAVTASSVAVPAALLADGPKTVRVSAAIFDKDGGMRIYATTIEVTNAAPSATLADVTVAEGRGPATLAVGDARDASAADVGAGLRYAYDLDDDGTWDDRRPQVRPGEPAGLGRAAGLADRRGRRDARPCAPRSSTRTAACAPTRRR